MGEKLIIIILQSIEKDYTFISMEIFLASMVGIHGSVIHGSDWLVYMDLIGC